MRRPAGRRFGLLAMLASCSSGRAEHTVPIATDVEPNTRDLTGSYWCSFDEHNLDHPRYPCRIIKRGDTLELAMTSGGEQVRGVVTLEADGFTFDGAISCTWDDDCTTELHGRFEPSGRGGFRGTFREDALILYLVPAPQNAFDGADDGGERHGSPDPHRQAESPGAIVLP